MIDEAVILLGGMGTRLLPYTKSVPKEMLPIYDVPNIFLLVLEAYNSGIKKIIFVVTKHNINLIKNFFSKDNYLDTFLKNKPDKKILLEKINNVINNMEFVYVYQKLLGTYGALYSAKKYLKRDNFIVMYGDDVVDCKEPLTKQLIDNYRKTNKMQVAVYKYKDNLPKAGIVVVDKENNIIDLVPSNSTNSKLIIHGRMLLNKKIFTIKDKVKKHNNGEYYLPYALLNFNNVEAYPYQGKYFNIGEKTGFIKASIYYALKDKNEKDDLLKFITTLKEE